jgi:inorganic pyrophosphatase
VPIEIEVVVEVPMGSRNKYEVDHETGVIRLDRQLFTSTRYPCDYGFIERTQGEDGDPLDVLVVVNEPTFPGCRINCRPIGLFAMRDENGPDNKILAVPVWERHRSWEELDDVPRQLLLEIQHFFDVYKDLEEGKWTKVGGWHGREDAEREIADARKRHPALDS